MGKKDKLIQEREALIEMYKAGFLDAYKLNNTLRSKANWQGLNDAYIKAFIKRFEKKVTKELKKGEKK